MHFYPDNLTFDLGTWLFKNVSLHVVKAYLISMTLSLKVNHFFIITYFFVYLATENFLCSAVYCIG